MSVWGLKRKRPHKHKRTTLRVKWTTDNDQQPSISTRRSRGNRRDVKLPTNRSLPLQLFLPECSSLPPLCCATGSFQGVFFGCTFQLLASNSAAGDRCRPPPLGQPPASHRATEPPSQPPCAHFTANFCLPAARKPFSLFVSSSQRLESRPSSGGEGKGRKGERKEERRWEKGGKKRGGGVGGGRRDNGWEAGDQ